MSHDIVTVGEAMLRLWVPAGRRLENASSFEVTVAGAEANVAMAAARMGADTAWLSALPNNPLGRRAAGEISALGVDLSGVRWVTGSRMGTYFVELSVPPRPITVVYDRAGSAAAQMDSDSIDWPMLEDARIVQISGITPALSRSCRALSLEVVQRAAAARATVVVDVNYRRMLWSPDDCQKTLNEMAPHVHLLIITAEDARDVLGLDGPPADTAAAISASLAIGRVVVTAGVEAHWVDGGKAGIALGYDGAGTVDRIGAGDAFTAGVLLGLLDDDLPGGIDRGMAMAALKLGIFGDQLTATPQEVAELMEGHSREVSR